MGILNVEKLAIHSLCKLMYRFSRNTLPNNISSLFTINREIHTHNTRQSFTPHLQKHNCALMKNSFICKSPLKWISLPVCIKNLASSTFNRKLKKHLLENE